jgi:hypothetical protein
MHAFGVLCWLLLGAYGVPAQVPEVPGRPPSHAHQADVDPATTIFRLESIYLHFSHGRAGESRPAPDVRVCLPNANLTGLSLQ